MNPPISLDAEPVQCTSFLLVIEIKKKREKERNGSILTHSYFCRSLDYLLAGRAYRFLLSSYGSLCLCYSLECSFNHYFIFFAGMF